MKIKIRVYDPADHLMRTDVLDLDQSPWILDYRGPCGWAAIGRIEIEPTSDDALPGSWIVPANTRANNEQ